MACNNLKCVCTNCTYDLCKCDDAKEYKSKTESGSCCCNN